MRQLLNAFRQRGWRTQVSTPRAAKRARVDGCATGPARTTAKRQDPRVFSNKSKLLLIVCAVLLLTSLPAQAAELIINGGFETGGFGATWVHGARRGNDYNPAYADHVINPDEPYSGNFSVLLGFKHTEPRRNATAFIYHDVTIPSNISEATLYFRFRMQGYDGKFGDRFVAEVRGTDDTVYEQIVSHSLTDWDHKFHDDGWLSDDETLPVGFDLSAYAGQTIRLYFEHANGSDNRFETWTYVDEISLICKKYVDLVIDGDGDDIFGELGAGGGGLSSSSGLAGDTLSYSLTIENEGNESDSYIVGSNYPSGWTVWLDDAGTPRNFPFTTSAILSSETKVFTVYVIPAPGTPTASYNVIVDAVSTSQANRFDSVTLRANVVDGVFGADLAVDGDGYGTVGEDGLGGSSLKEAPLDSVLSFDIELVNTGNDATSYTITFAEDPGVVASIWFEGAQYFTSFTTPVIPGGASLAMALDAEVPALQPGGDYSTLVTATAVADTLKKDTIKAIIHLLSPRIDMVIGGSGDDFYDNTFSGLGGASSVTGGRGTIAIFPLQIQNESAVPDSFTLDWVLAGNGWTVYLVVDGVENTFPYVTPTLDPYETMNCELRVLIPGAISFGTYTSYLHAVSLTDNLISESVTATMNVSQPGETDLTIDGSGLDVYGGEGTGLGGSSIQTVTPGDTAIFLLEVINLSGEDAFDINWNTPPDWIVTLDGQTSPVTGYPSGIYELRVIVPQTSSAGTFDIIVDGKKSGKPFFLDSVLGRVVVVFPVDAVIDGNGEDVCGQLGTGLGGSSTRATLPAATVNFSVEIQNEGSAADQYVVSWNSIPVWNASMDGNGSPYTTGFVAAGGSIFLTFSVDVPAGQTPADYQYIIDVVSLNDAMAVESIEAIVSVVPPPRVDLVIDGNGAGVFGPTGSGEGGTSVRGADAGSFYTAALEVRNVGSFPDSFYIEWEVPPGWPQTSMVINDGTLDHSAPFWTSVIPVAGQLDYIVKVQVPAAMDPNAHIALINSWSSLPPNNQESVKLITQAFAVVTGFVFDDRDHDGALSAGDIGLSGVVVREDASGLQAVTAGNGAYSILLPGSATALVIESNPSGYISLSPDSVGPIALNAGDTLRVDFADVLGLTISQGSVLNGLAGGYVDFPHVIVAGTEGHVDLMAVADSGVVTMFFFDENANGIFDGADRLLEGADGDLDPSTGNDQLYIIFRVFVPADAVVGATLHFGIVATQSITGTVVESQVSANDAVVVVGSANGLLALQKEVDKPTALPGEVITYTIHVFNAGIDSVTNIVLFDPISPFVDPLPDAFGPGLDVEWQYASSPPVYLTLNAADADECEFHSAESLLQMLFSKNGPFYLLPGQRGTLSYKARVK
jgi:uncharacterized repeat protein (TIGR01451 family)